MKKIIVSFLLGSLMTFLIVLTIPIYFHYQKQNILKEDSLSLMLETDFLSKEYEKSNDNKWPGEDYNFNKNLSKCENGSKLEWNEIDRTIKLKTNKTDKCYVYFDKSKIFKYTGAEQVFIVPEDGTYKIELWGASGGDIDKYRGGKGAYAIGNIELKKGNTLYVYVGGRGTNTEVGGYNGGGNLTSGQSVFGSSGGGATDVRLINGNWNEFESLKSRIMVAAGGGGANNRGIGYGAGNGGYGGTLIGGAGESPEETHTNLETGLTYGWSFGYGGTQTKGGLFECKYHLAAGRECNANAENGNFGYAMNSQSGGGSGYFAGAGGGHGGAGGGSSYISGYEGCVAIQEESTVENVIPKENCTEDTSDITCSYHYSNKIFTDTNMIAGNAEMPNPLGGIEIGHSGDGYARITLIS